MLKSGLVYLTNRDEGMIEPGSASSDHDVIGCCDLTFLDDDVSDGINQVNSANS